MIVATIHNGIRVGGEVIAQEVRGCLRKFILLFAGAIASAATDTQSAIE